MKSLVIGGNGFIGTNLVDALLRDGHKVRVFDRYPSRFREPNAEVEYVYGDFGNHGEVHDIVHGVDFVFHLAYTTLPHTSNEDPVYYVRSNVIDSRAPSARMPVEQGQQSGFRFLRRHRIWYPPANADH